MTKKAFDKIKTGLLEAIETIKGYEPEDDDDRDGVLFRFWIRAASYPGGWPSDTAKALAPCTTPAEYRAALTKLAIEKGVNLP